MADKNNESTMKWRVDISQLKSAMQDAKRSISLANAEFKTATAGIDKWSNSIEGLEAKLTQLNKNLPQQKVVLAELEEQYKLTAENMGENSKEANRLKVAIENQKATIIKTETNIKKYNEQLTNLKKQEELSNTAVAKLSKTIQEQQSKVDELKNAYKNAVIQYGKNSKEANELKNELSKLSKELAENKAQMKKADDAADDLDDSFDDLEGAANSASRGIDAFRIGLVTLISMGVRSVAREIKNLATEAFNAGANFEASMSQVQAISGASGDELERLTAKAKEMGAKTKFSATESAEAFNYMAMAGWKTEDMINGIEGIMNLAAASGADLATTSDIVTDALTAMGYAAGDAGQLADVMAAASSNANTNVELMGATFQYAAPIIGALGYSMEDAAVSIGLMANAGIKGEKAGTALRSILTRLSAPPTECANAMDELGISLTNSDGTMKEMNEVVDDLREAFSGLSETEQTSMAKHIAGQEAMSGLLAIVRAAPEDYDKLTKAVEESAGAAENMANVMQDNVSGQITLLKSKIEGIMIKVFEKMSKSIKKSIDTVSNTLDGVDWDKFAEGAANAVEVVANLFKYVIKNSSYILTALKTIATVFITYKTVTSIMAVIAAFKKFFALISAGKTIIQALNAVLSINPIALVAAGVAALAVATVSLYKANKKALESEYGLTKAQKEALDNANDLVDTYKELNEARNEQVTQVNAEYGYLKELKDEYNSLIDSNGKVKEGYEDRANFIINQLAQAMGLEVDEIQKLIDKNGELGDSIDEIILKKQAEATLLANESLYNEAIQNRTSTLNTLTEAREELANIEKEYNDQLPKYQQVMDNYNLLIESGSDAMWGYWLANKDVIDAHKILEGKLEEAKETVANAEGAWIGYNSTIQNYEGLSAAIISGDADKINLAMQDMTYNFITAETGNRESLERQVENYKTNLANLEQAIKDGTPSVTQEMVNQAASMVKAAEDELNKLPAEASTIGGNAGDDFANGIASKRGHVLTNADNLVGTAMEGLTPSITKFLTTGTEAGNEFGVGISLNRTPVKVEGEELAKKAVEGAETENGENGGAKRSGSNFAEGFFNGMGSWLSRIWERGKQLALNALAGLRKGQEEGSPSKLTRQSGEFFGEGYLLGIESMVAPIKSAASNVAKEAVDALGFNLKDQMKELGTESGQSLIDGINGMMPNVSSSVEALKKGVSSASVEVAGNQSVSAGVVAGQVKGTSQNITFNQYNTSPKALDRLSIYRDTNSLLFTAKVRMGNV